MDIIRLFVNSSGERLTPSNGQPLQRAGEKNPFWTPRKIRLPRWSRAGRVEETTVLEVADREDASDNCIGEEVNSG